MFLQKTKVYRRFQLFVKYKVMPQTGLQIET
jgi:hypothetical protein